MAILAQVSLQSDNISMRWNEPYTSAGLNRKSFATLPRGIYRGFAVTPVAGTHQVTIDAGTTGNAGYQGGAFDAAVGASWCIAVHESLSGYTANVLLQGGGRSPLFTFDLSAFAGTSVFAVIDVQYAVGYPTLGQVKIVEHADLDADPTLLVIAKIEVPVTAPISALNVIIDDANYPRVLPYASSLKNGFMTQHYAQILDALNQSTASNAYEVEFVVTTNGPQTIYIPAANIYTVDGNDLFIFKNGSKQTKGRDYTEIDGGDGHGNSVQWTGNLFAQDRIVFRGQAYAVSLTNTLSVLDEAALVQTNVTRINFTGTGVLALPDGPGRTKIVIPSAAANNVSKSKLNNTSQTIPQYTAVTLLSDGSVAPCDPKNPTHKPYALTAVSIAPAAFGSVYISGVAFNALVGIAGLASGMDIYISSGGNGQLTSVPPDPLVSQVFRIGIADCPDGIASSTATDVIIDRQRIL